MDALNLKGLLPGVPLVESPFFDDMGQAYRRWRDDYGDGWERAFRQTFEDEMINKNETHFFVGTVHQHPNNWIIVGLFYPPRPATADLLDRLNG